MHSPASTALADLSVLTGHLYLLLTQQAQVLQSQTTTAWVSARLRAEAQHPVVCHTHTTWDLRPQAASQHYQPLPSPLPHHCGASQVETITFPT